MAKSKTSKRYTPCSDGQSRKLACCSRCRALSAGQRNSNAFV